MPNLYYDNYDNSLVTATVVDDTVSLTREDGSPMWANGTSVLSVGHWNELVREGYFTLIDSSLEPHAAAEKLIRQIETG